LIQSTSPPEYFLDQNGRLTQPLQLFLTTAFGLSAPSLKETVWVSFEEGQLNTIDRWWCRITKLDRTFSATVKGNKVFYSKKKRTPLEWLYLIAHEQVHRHDIDAEYFFYLKYITEGVFTSYRNISAERRAYAISSLAPGKETDALTLLLRQKPKMTGALLPYIKEELSQRLSNKMV
jgi:hypothetical protein